jgi:hypothetical protein
MKKEFTFTVSSVIHCHRKQLWNDITKLKNVNYELMPILKMTYPKQADIADIQSIKKGEVLFKSYFLLLGFIPVDLHYLRVVVVKDGYFFHENSYSLINSTWKHHRTLEGIDEEYTKITDWIRFNPKIPFLGYILKPFIHYLFKHRHRRLLKKY